MKYPEQCEVFCAGVLKCQVVSNTRIRNGERSLPISRGVAEEEMTRGCRHLAFCCIASASARELIGPIIATSDGNVLKDHRLEAHMGQRLGLL